MNIVNRNISNSLFNNSFFKESDIFKADIYEEDNLYKIILDLPGFNKKDISIEYSNGYLNIKATKNDEINESTNFLHRERFYGEYKRTFYVGCIVENNIQAKYKDGLLSINLEKQNKNNQNIKIEIE